MTESQNTLVKGLKKINEINLGIKAETQTLYYDKNGRMIKMEDNLARYFSAIFPSNDSGNESEVY